MCGIVGYIGKKQAAPILLSGLVRLEYRGYDSFGICVFGQEPFVYKKVGKISDASQDILKMNIAGQVGIAHTRWATTGGVTDINSHPHWDCQKNIFLVHNGIIENYQEIRERLLQKGHKFLGETDTEVLAHLIESHFEGNLEKAVAKALEEVRGTYGLAVIAKEDPEKIVVARLSSPLLVGIANDGYIVGSDPMAVISQTDKVVYLDDFEIATITPTGIITQKEKTQHILDIAPDAAQKGSYPHFMLKEIMEEPRAVENAMQGRILHEQGTVKFGGLENVKERLQKINRFKFLACGTSHYASLLGKYYLEDFAGVLSDSDLASEFRYRQGILNPDLAGVFISQSGETADTLGALHELKNKNILTIGLTNVVGSTQSREVDAGIYLHCGPEIAVASTKAFVSQVTSLAMLAVYLGRQKKMDALLGKEIINALAQIPESIRQILEQKENVSKLAEKYQSYKNFFFLGRKYNYPVALEGALKLKEISYVHAEGIPGGEIKHGPLSLVDGDFVCVVVCPNDSVYDKMVVSIEEIKARKGKVIAIASEGNQQIGSVADDVIFVPRSIEMLNPLLTIVPMHLFAYYMAVLLGREVDKPRNLAKSVTVE